MTETRGITDEQILDALREQSGVGTSEVAETVGCTRQNADYRLRRLLDAGRVEKRTVGNSLFWTAAPDETEVEA